ncbi:MAG: hypothetical protein J7K21_02735 [Desulfurococcales archaeon]|nr:hypothetical protein [Desulfurococcales archaeon]
MEEKEQIVIFNAKAYSQEIEFYDLFFIPGNLIICKVGEVLASSKKKYSKRIDYMIKRIRIKRRQRDCIKISYDSILEYRILPITKNKELLFYIKLQKGREYLFHIKEAKKELLRNGIKILKKK